MVTSSLHDAASDRKFVTQSGHSNLKFFSDRKELQIAMTTLSYNLDRLHMWCRITVTAQRNPVQMEIFYVLLMPADVFDQTRANSFRFTSSVQTAN